MYRIKCLNKISPVGTERFSENYQCGEDVENPDAIMVRSASMHEMDFSKELVAIARAGAGVNNIPLDKCSEQGIVVFNTPGANANAVKELVIAGLLLSSRKIVQDMNAVFHLFNGVLVNHAVCIRKKRNMNGDIITCREYLVKGTGMFNRTGKPPRSING